jgi:hypothetical protein
MQSKFKNGCRKMLVNFFRVPLNFIYCYYKGYSFSNNVNFSRFWNCVLNVIQTVAYILVSNSLKNCK